MIEYKWIKPLLKEYEQRFGIVGWTSVIAERRTRRFGWRLTIPGRGFQYLMMAGLLELVV
jgi:hypothetical protein